MAAFSVSAQCLFSGPPTSEMPDGTNGSPCASTIWLPTTLSDAAPAPLLRDTRPQAVFRTVRFPDVAQAVQPSISATSATAKTSAYRWLPPRMTTSRVVRPLTASLPGAGCDEA